MNRSFFLGLLFALLGGVAISAGIALAEFHKRGGSLFERFDYNPKPLAPTVSEPKKIDFEALAASAKIILEDAENARYQLRIDCNYRHSSSVGVVDACIRDGMAKFLEIRDLWLLGNTRTNFAIGYCIGENPSLNGTDWSRVNWCVERAIVEIKKRQQADVKS